MKIQGINSQNIISNYNNNIGIKVDKVDKARAKDIIEISAVGKALNTFSTGEMKLNNASDIELIKNQVQNGTYNIDATATAQSIIDNIRGMKV